MKTIILNASPRVGKNTGSIVKKLEENLKGEVNTINVYDKKINPCKDCGFCKKNSYCLLSDDMDEITDCIKRCDNVVIASPMYFGNFPAPMKALIDRGQVLWNNQNNNNILKKAVFIVTAGSYYDNMFSGIEETARCYFKTINAKIVKCIYVADTDNFEINRNTNVINQIKEASKILNGYDT